MLAKLRHGLGQASRRVFSCVRRSAEEEMKAKMVDKYDQRVCACCLESLEKKSKTSMVDKCKHIYHRKCLMDWANACLEREVLFSCPMCREFIEICLSPECSSKKISLREQYKAHHKLPLRLPKENALLLGMIPVTEADLRREEEEMKQAKGDERLKVELEPSECPSLREFIDENDDDARSREMVTVFEFFATDRAENPNAPGA